MSDVTNIYWDEGKQFGIDPGHFCELSFVVPDEKDVGTLAIDKWYLANKINLELTFAFSEAKSLKDCFKLVGSVTKTTLEKFEALLDAYILLISEAESDKDSLYYGMQREFISYHLKLEMQREIEWIEDRLYKVKPFSLNYGFKFWNKLLLHERADKEEE